jgi:hypothetical protein
MAPHRKSSNQNSDRSSRWHCYFQSYKLIDAKRSYHFLRGDHLAAKRECDDPAGEPIRQKHLLRNAKV